MPNLNLPTWLEDVKLIIAPGRPIKCDVQTLVSEIVLNLKIAVAEIERLVEERDSLLAEVQRLQTTLQDITDYSPASSSRSCRLCVYEQGKLRTICGYHREILALVKEHAALRTRLEAQERIIGRLTDCLQWAMMVVEQHPFPTDDQEGRDIAALCLEECKKALAVARAWEEV